MLGKGVTQNEVEAVKWIRKAAEQGDAMGQAMLGACYYEGKGIDKDQAAAIRWYRLSAEQGYTDAEKELKKLGINVD